MAMSLSSKTVRPTDFLGEKGFECLSYGFISMACGLAISK